MKLHQLSENARPTIEGTTITAFHAGNKFDGGFDLKFSGSGEGYRILGPGTYFITNRDTASRYAQHARTEEAMLYTCDIKIDNFYNNALVPTERMEQTMAAIAKELGHDDFRKMPRNYDTLNNGRGFVGDVVKMAGHKRAQQLFIKHGLNGCLEFIGPEWEIAVFNLGCVSITEREPIAKPQ